VNTIGTFLFELFGKLLGKMPKWMIYGFSDLLYLIGFYLIGYRKKVVFSNLKNAFPEKSHKEIKALAKRFYRHLSDVMIENVVSLFMKPQRIKNFVSIRDIEMVNRLYKKNKNITGIIGHYGNWEFLTTIPPYTSYAILSVYKPLKNKFFDRKTYEMRRKQEAIPVPKKKVYKYAMQYETSKQPYILGLVSDQAPPRKNIDYWTTFLNQETAFFNGPEKIARRFNHAVIFTVVDKIKRGQYEIRFVELFENAANTTDNEITEAYKNELEKTIRNKPEYWLWSHRRWKHSRKKFNS